MKESIKKRIEAVRRGEVPEGYRIENGYLISDDWKTMPLNSRFTRSTRKNSTGCENVLTISAQMGLVNQREFYDKDIASEDKSGYFLMKNGEFAYNKSYSTGYPYGAIKQLTKYDEGIVSPLYICFAPKAGTNTAFYTQYFEGGQYNREIYRVAQEGARNHGLLNIAVDDFFTGTLVEPSAGEQQKIAEILATCDRMIELKQNKIDELNKLKQVCLLEMFPQKGQTIPKRRFPGFSAPWEQRKLGELIREISTGKSVNSDEGIVRADNIGVLKTSCVSYDCFDPSESKPVVKDERHLAKCAVEKDSVIVSRMNTPERVGACGYVERSFPNLFLPDRLWKLKFQENVDTYFLYTMLISGAYKEKITSMASGTSGSMYNIPKDAFLNLRLTLSLDIDEQKKIGDYFKQLDNLITLHQRELAEVGKYKKALMQLLLTGLVRVNA